MKDNTDEYWGHVNICWVSWIMFIAGSTPPKTVKHAPRLKDDLESLKELLSVVKLSVRYVRAASI